MRAHKNWGIAAFIFLLLTFFSAAWKPFRKSYPFWGCLTIFCMIGALTSGSRIGHLKEKAAPVDEAAS